MYEQEFYAQSDPSYSYSYGASFSQATGQPDTYSNLANTQPTYAQNVSYGQLYNSGTPVSHPPAATYTTQGQQEL
jgi:hypothetical protein